MFTLKSDVWSFGVLMWEMFSFGRTPYAKLNHKVRGAHGGGTDARGPRRSAACAQEVSGELEKGLRLERPMDCPENVYGLMADCWAYKPLARPSFEQLQQQLKLV